MGMVFKYDLAEGIAQLSYLIGDDASATAAVIDPRPDCEIYYDWADELGVAITHIFETHNHADFMSGARELADHCGAPIYLAPEPAKEYGFDFKTIKDGDTFTFGKTVLTARHTPGHTDAHMAFEVAEKDKGSPWGVFTGDSLFVDSVGRPDLSDREEELSKKLYATLYGYYLHLDDGVIIYPGHGKGSACGPDIGDRLQSTIGYERSNNRFLQCGNSDAFVKLIQQTAPPEPAHYARLKKTNAAGPPLLSQHRAIHGLPPQAFHERAASGRFAVVDTRSIHAFGGGHVPGAINIADRPELSVYAGWMLDAEKPIFLIVEDTTELERIRALFHRTGFVRFEGYLAGGMKAWVNAGMPLKTLDQITVHDIQRNGRYDHVLDVRAPDEWNKGHISGAEHFFIGDMRDRLPDLSKSDSIAVYCGSGYRASIAASLLQANGFEDVANVPGSWSAWKNAGYPVANGED